MATKKVTIVVKNRDTLHNCCVILSEHTIAFCYCHTDQHDLGEIIYPV